MHAILPHPDPKSAVLTMSKRYGNHRIHANFSVDKKTADRIASFLQSVPGVDARVQVPGEAVPVK